MTDLNRSLQPHDFTYHVVDYIAACDVCELESNKLLPLAGERSTDRKDVCAPCVKEGSAPDGFAVQIWCTDCESTIPEELRPESLAVGGDA